MATSLKKDLKEWGGVRGERDGEAQRQCGEGFQGEGDSEIHRDRQGIERWATGQVLRAWEALG